MRLEVGGGAGFKKHYLNFLFLSIGILKMDAMYTNQTKHVRF